MDSSHSVATANTTVCVTGATGFIGSWLVMRLLQRGYTVRATVRDPGEFYYSSKAKTFTSVFGKSLFYYTTSSTNKC